MALKSDIWLIMGAVDIDLVCDGRMIICMDINLLNHMLYFPAVLAYKSLDVYVFSIIDMCHNIFIKIYKHITYNTNIVQ